MTTRVVAVFLRKCLGLIQRLRKRTGVEREQIVVLSAQMDVVE